MKEEIKNKHSSIQPKHTHPRRKMDSVLREKNEDGTTKLFYYQNKKNNIKIFCY